MLSLDAAIAKANAALREVQRIITRLEGERGRLPNDVQDAFAAADLLLAHAEDVADLIGEYDMR